MAYFCFIESTAQSVPHMEPLIAVELDEAKLEAEALLEQHASGYVAKIFDGDEQVASVRRGKATGIGGARGLGSSPA